MYSFLNDYSEGAHQAIMEALLRTNLEQTEGYGLDPYCEEARELIKSKIKKNDAEVHFLAGGTQTNQTAIAAFLKPYQAVIATEYGHINVHETGAIEATGHKVLVAKSKEGKLTPSSIREVVKAHSDEHMVQPKLVYISNATELGTIYQKKELEVISEVCRELNLYLYLDGARLGSALMSEKNDLTLETIASLTDAFYIGGTKNGALFGEALILLNESLQQDFRYMIKRQGGMLAKGRLLGIQFYELWKEDLYLHLSKHANECALKLKKGLEDHGCSFLSDSYTNQQFPILKNSEIKILEKQFKFSVGDSMDEEHSYIRLVTSWATTNEGIDAFLTGISLLK